MRGAPLVIVDIVGLTPALLGDDTPNLNRLVDDGFLAHVDGAFPAVTCTAQASMLTGTQPREHGIVANGWYFRDLNEIWFWRQSNRLVEARNVWEEFTGKTAVLFWWFNMATSADLSVTPRPAAVRRVRLPPPGVSPSSAISPIVAPPTSAVARTLSNLTPSSEIPIAPRAPSKPTRSPPSVSVAFSKSCTPTDHPTPSESP